ncbi:MAG: hypothetical protein M1834_005852 [Cirrosporium novae-zelandiae]|nr:MAG: hypothetical protein M1834_005852 [Cirrosporium novae-zelandiae]
MDSLGPDSPIEISSDSSENELQPPEFGYRPARNFTPTGTHAQQSDNSATDNQKVYLNEAPTPEESRGMEENVCFDKVLEVFPDASHRHIHQICKNKLSSSEASHSFEYICQEIILDIIEAGKYPKEANELGSNSRKRAHSSTSSEDDIERWQQTDKDADYIKKAQITLQNEFPLIPVDHINITLKQNISLYTSYIDLGNSERKFPAPQKHAYHHLRRPRKPKTNFSRPSPTMNNHNLGFDQDGMLKELQAAKRQLRKEEAKRQIKHDAQVASELNEQEHKGSGGMIECQTCFDEVPFNMSTYCSGDTPHFFCLGCAKHLAEVIIGNSQYELKCMDGSGCVARFGRDQIRRFLDTKLIEALDRNEQREMIKLAGLDGLTECPFCSYKEILPPVEVDREFHCQLCKRVSCRLCNLDSHIPLTCEEAAQERRLPARHAVEEAMTSALIRECPKCKTPAVKESGCNRMRCPTCNVEFCYLCKQDITQRGYAHFSNHLHGQPGASVCVLHDADGLSRMHEQQVAEAEKEAIAKAQAENPELAVEDIKVKLSDAVKGSANWNSNTRHIPEARDGGNIRNIEYLQVPHVRVDEQMQNAAQIAHVRAQEPRFRLLPGKIYGLIDPGDNPFLDPWAPQNLGPRAPFPFPNHAMPEGGVAIMIPGVADGPPGLGVLDGAGPEFRPWLPLRNILPNQNVPEAGPPTNQQQGNNAPQVGPWYPFI